MSFYSIVFSPIQYSKEYCFSDNSYELETNEIILDTYKQAEYRLVRYEKKIIVTICGTNMQRCPLRGMTYYHLDIQQHVILLLMLIKWSMLQQMIY